MIFFSKDNKVTLSWSCLYFLLVGATMRIDINLFGRVALGEILMMALFPFAILKIRELFKIKLVAKLGIFIFLWILGTIISDLLNDTPFIFFIKGLARPTIVFIMLVSCYYLIIKNPLSAIYFFFGLFISGILNYFIPTDFRVSEFVGDLSGSDPSYAYYAYVWTPLFYGLASVVGYLIYKYSPCLSGIFQIFLGIVTLPIMSRTTGFVFIISGLLIIMTSLFSNMKERFLLENKILKSGVKRAVFSSLIIIVMVYYSYSFFAKNNYLGERQQEKYEMQSGSAFGNTPWGVLLYGRHYTLGAIIRIIENPVFGAGSWPKQGNTMIKAYKILGIKATPEALDFNRREIGHSIIFGMWAQSGLLVLPFFFLVIITIFRFMVFLIFTKSRIKPLMLVYLLSLIFGIFFNNFNSLARLELVLIPLIYQFYIVNDVLVESD